VDAALRAGSPQVDAALRAGSAVPAKDVLFPLEKVFGIFLWLLITQ